MNLPERLINSIKALYKEDGEKWIKTLLPLLSKIEDVQSQASMNKLLG